MLDLIRFLFDFGVLVFVLQVQLVGLPSLKWQEGNHLATWTSKYAEKMLNFIIILSPSQLCVYAMQIYFDQNLYTLAS